MTSAAVGTRAPSCYGVGAGRTFYSFEEQYGRPAVLILAGAGSIFGLLPVIGAVTARGVEFAARNADVLLLVDDNPSAVWQGDPSAIRTIDCGDFLRRCDVGGGGSLVLVLDRNLRVAMRLQSADGADVAAACLECLDRLPREEPRVISQPAPVILLSNLLPLDVCRSLIERFESSPTIDGEVARIDAAGNVRSVVDHARKSRRDLPIGVDDPRHGWLGEALLHRVAPEIAKAFQARVAHCDRMLVCRYDRSAGWFRRHRDNAAANTAFREFALSLNLNSGDYEGGHLLFPEYNDHCYRPPAGAGVIFSAALLHEVAPVTGGQRYVLLTFFHGDAAEARRLAYLAGAGSPPTGLTPAPPPPLRS